VLLSSVVLSWLWLWPTFKQDWAMSEIRRSNPRAVILGDLLNLLSEIEDSRARYELQAREKWMGILEDVAWMIERRLPGRLLDHDPVVRTQVVRRASAAAMAVRTIAGRIAAPEASSWDWLTSELRHEAKAIATGNFGELKQQSPSSTPIDRRARIPISNELVLAAFLIILFGAIAFSFQKEIADRDVTAVAGLIASAIAPAAVLWRSRPK
jgi:hypothetical protein